VEVIFLYQHLYHTARKQLEALRRLDFGTLEALTREREKITSELCRLMQDSGGEQLGPAAKKRIREFTAKILDLDGEIKEVLLEELKERTLALSGLTPHGEES